MTEATRIFWRMLCGLIGGAEAYGDDLDVLYEQEDDEQGKFSKARYYRKYAWRSEGKDMLRRRWLGSHCCRE